MLRNTVTLPDFGSPETCIPCGGDVTYTASCTIPVDGGGRLHLHHYVYRDPTSGGQMEIPVLTSPASVEGTPDSGGGPAASASGSAAAGAAVPLVRVHDQCVTSEVFGSLKCDCREQLQLALRRLSSEPGAVIYMPQEGRGIGLGNKVRAYHLQETEGLDTVDANLALGLPEEARRYDAVPAILAHLKIRKIRLMTNNPMKVESLRKLGVDIVSREPCIVRPTPHSRAYFETKTRRMNHILPALFGAAPKTKADSGTIDSDTEKLVISTIPFDTSAMHSKL